MSSAGPDTLDVRIMRNVSGDNLSCCSSSVRRDAWKKTRFDASHEFRVLHWAEASRLLHEDLSTGCRISFAVTDRLVGGSCPCMRHEMAVSLATRTGVAKRLPDGVVSLPWGSKASSA